MHFPLPLLNTYPFNAKNSSQRIARYLKHSVEFVRHDGKTPEVYFKACISFSCSTVGITRS